MNKVLHGDSRMLLKFQPDNSVDAIVTDPPYGLSDKRGSQKINDFIQRSFNIIFPNLNEFNVKRIKYFDFLRILKSRSLLGDREIVNCIKPFIRMPESTVDLNGNILMRNKEVNTSTETSSFNISNTVLMNKVDIERGKYIGNYVFDFGDSVDFARGDIISGNFGEFNFGCFCMPISSIESSFFPCDFSHCDTSFMRNGINDIVGIFDNSFSKSFAPTFVLASSTTENSLMLRFNLTNTSDEKFATITANESNTISEFICPKLIRTFTTASSFSTKLEPCTVSFIANSADGTDSLYYFHLYLPLNFIANMQKISENAKGFMGKKWDYDVPSVNVWKDCLRVLKPGGYLLCFAGTRTQHRMACNIEDAGFEIRDMIAWVYGSGFPKSLSIGVAVDKLQENKRDIIGDNPNHRIRNNPMAEMLTLNNPETTKGTSEWEGWGTALKPALEPITVARKPLEKGLTVAQNCLKWGTGGINIDACRVPVINEKNPSGSAKRVYKSNEYTEDKVYGDNTETSPLGRFPANLIHDGSDDVLVLFPDSKGQCGDLIGHNKERKSPNDIFGTMPAANDAYKRLEIETSAARFFYCPKASKAERNKGCEELEEKHFQMRPFANEGCDQSVLKNRMNSKVGTNNHPTVKPLALIEYLVKLVSREGSIVLDPYGGSGTTALACLETGRRFIVMERELDYIKIINSRISGIKTNSDTQLNIFENLI